jgi:hypothetical protein
MGVMKIVQLDIGMITQHILAKFAMQHVTIALDLFQLNARIVVRYTKQML